MIAFDRVLTASVSSDTGGSNPYVVSLANAPAGRLPTAAVGGKAATLSRLLDAGIFVPPAICVTTRWYTESLRELLIEEIDRLDSCDPDETQSIAAHAEQCRERIREQSLPESLRSEIDDALSAVPGETYAVRSSGTAEDQPGQSFAGQYETYLDVERADVIDRIRDCLASLFTERAVSYRLEQNIDHDEIAMAVLIQQQVHPESAGVLFTADPQSGSRSTAVIEATRGLGTGVVAGTESTDELRYDLRADTIVEYAAVGDEPILSASEIDKLVGVSKQIEAALGMSQDIEWAIVEGTPIILQARPITTLFPRPSPQPDDDQRHVYISVGHGQAYANAMPPLASAFWIETARSMVSADADQLLVKAGGRLYIDVTAMLSMPGGWLLIERMFGSINGSIGAALSDLRTRTDRPNSRLSRESLGQLVELATAFVPMWGSLFGDFVGALIGGTRPPADEHARWNEWGAELARQMTAHESIDERVSAVLGDSETAFDYPPVGALYAAIAVDQWLNYRFGDDPETSAAVNAVGRGFPEELITTLTGELEACATIAAEHPELADALERGATLDELETKPGGPAFLEAFESILEEYGHRATGEFDISNPRWKDDPEPLLATIRARIDEEQEHDQRIEALQKAAERSQTLLEARTGGPIRRWLLARAINTYRGAIQTRELPKHGVARLLDVAHDTFAEAGERLTRDGTLENPDDVWFLHPDELRTALAGTPIDAPISDRRRAFDRHKQLTPPPVILSDGETIMGAIERDDVPDDALVGVGVSDGVVEGRVRVITDPSAETIKPGEILVAPACGPGWTPLFVNASGLVMAVGGQLSHGALVAREYGLPAVASVADAPDRLETGDCVRIDGESGVVEPLE